MPSLQVTLLFAYLVQTSIPAEKKVWSHLIRFLTIRHVQYLLKIILWCRSQSFLQNMINRNTETLYGEHRGLTLRNENASLCRQILQTQQRTSYLFWMSRSVPPKGNIAWHPKNGKHLWSIVHALPLLHANKL